MTLKRKNDWAVVCIGACMMAGASVSAKEAESYHLTAMNYVVMNTDAGISSNPIQTQSSIKATTAAKAGGVAVHLNEVVHPQLSGIGGAFNEQGGEAFMSLPAEKRKAVAEALFNPKTGAGLTFCRTAVGSSDFGLGAYSYSETPDDYAMKHFSVERDTTSVLPFIRAAQAENPKLRIFASPWSPPGWMKKSGTMDKGGKDSVLINDPKIYQAYALYFEKYVKAYAESGITIDRLIIQNETDMNPHYPGCDMPAAQMSELVTDYICPQFTKAHLDTEIWAGTFRGIDQEGMRWDATDFMKLEGRKHVAGLGMQYSSPKIMKELREKYPDMKLMHTEGRCCNGKNSASQARSRFNEIRTWLYSGTENYCYWNMVLNEEGKSGWGWKQNSLMLIDRQTKDVTYTADFAPLALLSRSIRPGDQLLKVSGNARAIAVRNSKQLVVLLDHQGESPVSKQIEMAGQTIEVELPAQSVCAFIFEK